MSSEVDNAEGGRTGDCSNTAQNYVETLVFDRLGGMFRTEYSI